MSRKKAVSVARFIGKLRVFGDKVETLDKVKNFNAKLLTSVFF